MSWFKQREVPFALFCLLVYVLSGVGVITHVDGVVNYALARSLVDHGAFWLDPNQPALQFNPVPVVGADGRTYAPYNLGLPLLIAPLYAVGAVLSKVLPHFAEFTAADFLVSMTNALVTAATAWVVVSFVLEFGFGRRAALLAGAGFAFGSMAWMYSTTLFTEPATGLCVLSSALLLVRSRRSPRPAVLLLAAGVAAGGALFMRITGALFVPGLALYLLLIHRQAGWRLAWLLAAFGVGVAVLLAATGWYNFVRFGSPLETGYTVGGQGHNELASGVTQTAGRLDEIVYALYAMLLSPGRGVFLYAPVMLLGVLGLPTLFRRWPLEAALLIVLSGSLVVGESVVPFDYWWGGWSYGPRYLVPIIGFGAVSAGAWFASVSRGSRVGWLAGAALVVIIVMQIPSVLTNIYTPYYRAQVERGTATDRAYLIDSWQGATYVGGWRELARLTERTVQGQPVPRARMADEPNVAVALDQAEVLNTFQPWWIRLVQSGRVSGAAEVGVLALVGLVVAGALLTLRVVLGPAERDGQAHALTPVPTPPQLASRRGSG